MRECREHLDVDRSRRVSRCVLLNAVLWTAGNSLTTGGFLMYFVYEIGVSATVLAVVAILPETAGLAGLPSRMWLGWAGSRKVVWLVASLVARLATLLVPLAVIPAGGGHAASALAMILVGIGAAGAAQAISRIAYDSWLSDLIAPEQWGRIVTVRQIGSLLTLLVVPITGAWLRQQWKDALPKGDAQLTAYACVFVAGVTLMLLSLWPLLLLPNAQRVKVSRPRFGWSGVRTVLRRPGVRPLLLHFWTLAAANGLTQAVFYKYQISVLELSLWTYYCLFELMLLLQIPFSFLTGPVCDHYGGKWPLFWGTLITATALPFWMLSTAGEWWWVAGAFACWGAFGAVNVAQTTTLFSVLPRSDNCGEIALFQVVSGLLAGFTGLLGGLWLDSRLELAETNTPFGIYGPIFLVSWIGRTAAALVVLRMPTTRPNDEETAN